jgi:hypothetical protein
MTLAGEEQAGQGRESIDVFMERQEFEFCRLTLRTFDMLLCTELFPVHRSCFVFLKVAGFQPLNFDYCNSSWASSTV